MKKAKRLQFKIRRATLKDLEVLVQQRHMMFEDIRRRSPAELKVADLAYRKWAADLMKKRKFVGFLAVVDGNEIVGGGCVWLKDLHPFPGSVGSEPYLLSMYTKPKFRGNGIATAIVKEAMAWGKRKGYSTMTLHASEFGRPVYRKLGWKRSWEMRIDLRKFTLKNRTHKPRP